MVKSNLTLPEPDKGNVASTLCCICGEWFDRKKGSRIWHCRNGGCKLKYELNQDKDTWKYIPASKQKEEKDDN